MPSASKKFYKNKLLQLVKYEDSFIRSEKVARNIRAFHFAKPEGLDYTPGQFIQATLPHPKADDRGKQRWFTLSSSPTEGDLFITTKFYDQPSTFKQALRSLKEGDKIEVNEPSGDFVLPEQTDQELVLVAGGIGVTPYRSMIKYLTDKGDNPYKLHLFYAANTPAELAFGDLFDSGLQNLKVTYMVREPSDDWDGAVGTLSAKKIDELAGGVMSKTVYLSGPEPMVETLDKQLRDAGQPEENIKTDYFPNYPDY